MSGCNSIKAAGNRSMPTAMKRFGIFFMSKLYADITLDNASAVANFANSAG